MRRRLDSRKRIPGRDQAECAFTDTDAVQSDIIKHLENASPNIEAVGGRAVGEIGEAIDNGAVHSEIENNAKDRNGEDSHCQKMFT